MPVLSSVRARRFANRKTEVIHSLITFRLRREWFAVPIEKVQKVIILELLYSDPQRPEISLTHYQSQEIVVINVDQRIFGETEPSLTSQKPSYLAIIENNQGELTGLPFDSPPSIRRVPYSAFVSITDNYLKISNICCLSSNIIQLGDHPSLFLLDTQKLSC
jgi:chemotaxis signal transduction protein